MKKCVSTWVFRLEIASDKTPWTKDIKKELVELLFQAKLFGNFYIEEDLGGCAFHVRSDQKTRKKETVKA